MANVVRLEKGKNDFAIANLTLGQVMSIKQSLEILGQNNALTPVAYDVLCSLSNVHLEMVDPFGEEMVGEVTAKV